MASYHFCVKSGNYGSRQTSAVAHSDYIERNNSREKNFSDECIYKECNLPEWANNNSKTFWESAEKFERINACVYKELEINLQNELSLKENLKVIHELMENEPMKNFYYTLAIHDKKNSSIEGVRHLHAHIMFSERLRDDIERPPEKFFKRYNNSNPHKGGAKKSRLFADRKKGKETIRYLRELYADITNKIFKENNLDLRIDHRTLKEQRQEALAQKDFFKAELLDREPGIHLGRKRINENGVMLKQTKEARELEREHKKMLIEFVNLGKEIQSTEQYISTLKQQKQQQQEIKNNITQIKQIDIPNGKKFGGKILTDNYTVLTLPVMKSLCQNYLEHFSNKKLDYMQQRNMSFVKKALEQINNSEKNFCVLLKTKELTNSIKEPRGTFAYDKVKNIISPMNTTTSSSSGTLLPLKAAKALGKFLDEDARGLPNIGIKIDLNFDDDTKFLDTVKKSALQIEEQRRKKIYREFF